MTQNGGCAIDLDSPSPSARAALSSGAAPAGSESPQIASPDNIPNLIRRNRSSRGGSVMLSDRILLGDESAAARDRRKDTPRAKRRSDGAPQQQQRSSRQQSPSQLQRGPRFPDLPPLELRLLILMLTLFVVALFAPSTSPIFIISAVVLLVVHIRNKKYANNKIQ